MMVTGEAGGVMSKLASESSVLRRSATSDTRTSTCEEVMFGSVHAYEVPVAEEVMMFHVVPPSSEYSIWKVPDVPPCVHKMVCTEHLSQASAPFGEEMVMGGLLVNTLLEESTAAEFAASDTLINA
jgi:hypothetical protein